MRKEGGKEERRKDVRKSYGKERKRGRRAEKKRRIK